MSRVPRPGSDACSPDKADAHAGRRAEACAGVRRGRCRGRARGAQTLAVRADQRGYTLIEVIVAFALLALALTLLLGTLSGALRQVRWSGDAGRAALHAQSLIDQVGVGAPVEPGTRSGEVEDGRYRWTLEVSRWVEPQSAAAPRDPSAPQLLEVRLAMRWGDGGPRERLQLRTLRLQPAGVEASLP